MFEASPNDVQHQTSKQKDFKTKVNALEASNRLDLKINLNENEA